MDRNTNNPHNYTFSNLDKFLLQHPFNSHLSTHFFMSFTYFILSHKNFTLDYHYKLQMSTAMGIGRLPPRLISSWKARKIFNNQKTLNLAYGLGLKMISSYYGLMRMISFSPLKNIYTVTHFLGLSSPPMFFADVNVNQGGSVYAYLSCQAY